MFTFFLAYQGMISFVVKKCLITGWSKATLYEARAVELLILFLMIKWAATFLFFFPFWEASGLQLGLAHIRPKKKKKFPTKNAKGLNFLYLLILWISVQFGLVVIGMRVYEILRYKIYDHNFLWLNFNVVIYEIKNKNLMLLFIKKKKKKLNLINYKS